MSFSNKAFRLVSLVAIAVFVLAAGQASAADSGWFVGAKLGQADGDVQLGSRHSKRFDDDPETFGVELGYTVNRYLSIQAGFQDLGNYVGFGPACSEDEEVCIQRLASFGLCAEGFECAQVVVGLEADISAFSLALVPTWPLGERAGLFGKLAVMAWEGEVALDDSAGLIEGFPVDDLVAEKFSGEEFVVGVGLEFALTDSLGLVLEHDELALSLSSTSAGLRWKF